MRIVVIGGTGHIGGYLIPRLAGLGHEVVVVSRGTREPYRPDAAWNQVERVTADRAGEDAAGTFGGRIADLRPDAVVDLVCFTRSSAEQLVDALPPRTHLLHCGTIWVYGHATEVPATEDQPRRPIDEYGVGKAAIEAYLHGQDRVAATVLHAGHIVGPGWAPVNPAGHLDPDVFGRLARGERLVLPNLGMETLHHVHADDVAQAFERALHHRAAATGESFHVVSPAAITLRGYAEAVAAWFGREADLGFAPYDEWKGAVEPDDAAATWSHIAHSPNASIAKARHALGYAPRYTSLQAVQESLAGLVAAGKVDTGGRPLVA